MDEQRAMLTQIKLEKNKILKNIANKNVLLSPNEIETYLEKLMLLTESQKKIWKERHSQRRKKYDQSDRAKELSKIRSKRSYMKKKAATAAH